MQKRPPKMTENPKDKLDQLDKDFAILKYRMDQMDALTSMTTKKLDELPEKIARVLDEKIAVHTIVCSPNKDDKPKDKALLDPTNDILGRVISALIGLIATLVGIKIIQ